MSFRASLAVLGILANSAAYAQTPSSVPIAGSCKEPLARLSSPSGQARIQTVIKDVLAGRWPRPSGMPPEQALIAAFLGDLTARTPVLPDIQFHSELERLSAEFSRKPERREEIQEQVLTCFPSFRESLQRDADEKAKEQEKLLALQRQHTLERQQQEEAIRREEQRRAEEARKPENLLRTSYANYIFIKRCYEARQGYSVIYVSDHEMARSRRAISRIEEKLKSELPSGVTTNTLWSDANTVFARERMPIILPACQMKLRALEQTYLALVPEDSTTPKDFD